MTETAFRFCDDLGPKTIMHIHEPGVGHSLQTPPNTIKQCLAGRVRLVIATDTFIKILTRRGGGMGYCRLTEFVVPALRDVGVSDFDIRQMTVENPARLLAV